MTNGATYAKEKDVAGVLPIRKCNCIKKVLSIYLMHVRKIKKSITHKIWCRQQSEETLHGRGVTQQLQKL